MTKISGNCSLPLAVILLSMGFVACGCGQAVTRPQPSGPDANHNIALNEIKNVMGSEPAGRISRFWNTEKKSRFEEIVMQAELLKPGDPETLALKNRFERLLGKWRTHGDKIQADRISRQKERNRHIEKLPDTFVNSIGITMKLILPGTFVMGSNNGFANERPTHKVEITAPFYIGVYEITGNQYAKIMGGVGLASPKVQVSWNDAMLFCQKLSEQEGIRYVLPTEAQWEYACRAGTQTKFNFGDDWIDIAARRANVLGLYDMHGNVWEWCNDWYRDSYLGYVETLDPQGPDSGPNRVLRGGSWLYHSWFCRSASRYKDGPDSRSTSVGFRVVVVSSMK